MPCVTWFTISPLSLFCFTVTVVAPDAAIMEWFETAFVKMMAQVDILLAW